MQPLDAGVIAPLKTRYRKNQYNRALTLIENENTKDLYIVNILQAMNWVNTNWQEIDRKIIHNCWKKTGLISSITIENAVDIEETSNDSVNLEGEDDCVGFISDEKLVQIGLGNC